MLLKIILQHTFKWISCVRSIYVGQIPQSRIALTKIMWTCSLKSKSYALASCPQPHTVLSSLLRPRGKIQAGPGGLEFRLKGGDWTHSRGWNFLRRKGRARREDDPEQISVTPSVCDGHGQKCAGAKSIARTSGIRKARGRVDWRRRKWSSEFTFCRGEWRLKCAHCIKEQGDPLTLGIEWRWLSQDTHWTRLWSVWEAVRKGH